MLHLEYFPHFILLTRNWSGYIHLLQSHQTDLAEYGGSDICGSCFNTKVTIIYTNWSRPIILQDKIRVVVGEVWWLQKESIEQYGSFSFKVQYSKYSICLNRLNCVFLSSSLCLKQFIASMIYCINTSYNPTSEKLNHSFKCAVGLDMTNIHYIKGFQNFTHLVFIKKDYRHFINTSL